MSEKKFAVGDRVLVLEGDHAGKRGTVTGHASDAEGERTLVSFEGDEGVGGRYPAEHLEAEPAAAAAGGGSSESGSAA